MPIAILIAVAVALASCAEQRAGVVVPHPDNPRVVLEIPEGVELRYGKTKRADETTAAVIGYQLNGFRYYLIIGYHDDKSAKEYIADYRADRISWGDLVASGKVEANSRIGRYGVYVDGDPDPIYLGFIADGNCLVWAGIRMPGYEKGPLPPQIKAFWNSVSIAPIQHDAAQHVDESGAPQQPH